MPCAAGVGVGAGEAVLRPSLSLSLSLSLRGAASWFVVGARIGAGVCACVCMLVHVLARRSWHASATGGFIAQKAANGGRRNSRKGGGPLQSRVQGPGGARLRWAERSFLLVPVAARAFLTVSPRSSPPSSHFTRFTGSARHMHPPFSSLPPAARSNALAFHRHRPPPACQNPPLPAVPRQLARRVLHLRLHLHRTCQRTRPRPLPHHGNRPSAGPSLHLSRLGRAILTNTPRKRSLSVASSLISFA
jgi:hypothetical protein